MPDRSDQSGQVSITQVELEKWREERCLQLAQNEHATYDSRMAASSAAAAETANLALKSLLLINGGALVALLAFLSRGPSDGSGEVTMAEVVWPGLAFSVGLLSSSVGMVMAYLTHASQSDAFFALNRAWDHPWVTDTDEAKTHRRRAERWRMIGLGAAGVALSGFGAGAAFTLSAMGQ